jgi:hypothetical protein
VFVLQIDICLLSRSVPAPSNLFCPNCAPTSVLYLPLLFILFFIFPKLCYKRYSIIPDIANSSLAVNFATWANDFFIIYFLVYHDTDYIVMHSIGTGIATRSTDIFVYAAT